MLFLQTSLLAFVLFIQGTACFPRGISCSILELCTGANPEEEFMLIVLSFTNGHVKINTFGPTRWGVKACFWMSENAELGCHIFRHTHTRVFVSHSDAKCYTSKQERKIQWVTTRNAWLDLYILWIWCVGACVQSSHTSATEFLGVLDPVSEWPSGMAWSLLFFMCHLLGNMSRVSPLVQLHFLGVIGPQME